MGDRSMSGLFSPGELRLLAASDAAMNGPGRGHSNGRRKNAATGGIGSLTREEAVAMHEAGASAKDIAEAAGVTPHTVSAWRRHMGLARRYGKGDA